MAAKAADINIMNWKVGNEFYFQRQDFSIYLITKLLLRKNNSQILSGGNMNSKLTLIVKQKLHTLFYSQLESWELGSIVNLPKDEKQ